MDDGTRFITKTSSPYKSTGTRQDSTSCSPFCDTTAMDEAPVASSVNDTSPNRCPEPNCEARFFVR